MKHFFTIEGRDQKTVLLYRFHLMVIFINLIAVIIDFISQRYNNVILELIIVAVLSVNVWFLYSKGHTEKVAYVFLATLSIALLTIIHINHFATMSIVFILLLPLMTLLFIRFKYSMIIELLLFIIIGILLYIEYLNNPSNPITQNPKALFTLAYTAIIIYVFGLLYHLSIQHTFIELDEANRQKELLLKEVHHRVKNNLNVIASIVGLQANTLSGREQDELLKSKSRIESIASVHEMLYRSDDLSSIDFYAYTKHLSDLMLNMLVENKNIHINIKADGLQIPLKIMIQLGMIINELLTNSIKYAFHKKSGEINIQLTYNNGNYTFLYSDNGIGVENPEKLFTGNTLGIKIVKIASKQLGSKIELSSPKGLQYKIRFPDERA